MEVFLALAMLSTAVPPATHAQTSGPIRSFISPLDYPLDARPHEGTVSVALGVDVRGRVTSCVVQKSSGSAALDAATCRLLTRRAKFKPALTGDGKATSDTIQVSIPWKMPPANIMSRMSAARH